MIYDEFDNDKNLSSNAKREDVCMDIEKYTVEGRSATLYMAGSKDSPLIVLNNFSEDGGPVAGEDRALLPVPRLLCRNKTAAGISLRSCAGYHPEYVRTALSP